MGKKEAEISENHKDLSKTRGLVFSYFKEYCQYSTIHGFKYIAEDRRISERIWWIISLLLSVILCGLMIYQIIQKYVNYPVIVTFSMQETPMNQIPFPAVTICPRSKISQDYFNLTKAIIQKNNNDSFRGETERTYNLASTICDFYSTNESNDGTTSEDFYNFLNMNMADNFHYCAYMGVEFHCPNFYTPILTEEGICYSFNILNKMDIYHDDIYILPQYHNLSKPSRWDIEKGYATTDVDVYPFRAFRPGAKNGLFMVLKTKNSDIEYDCSSDDSGYRRTVSDLTKNIMMSLETSRALNPQHDSPVALHLPSKIPEVSESYITVPFNQRVIGQIIPHMIKTSDGVKAFDPITRDCYFQSERTLKFFKIYTQENCLIECKTNFTLEACDCVGFYMPRYNNTPVCILDNIECMEKAEVNFSMLSINLPFPDFVGKIPTLDCDCLPTCTDLSYNLEISQNTFVYKPRDISMQLDEGYEYSILQLYFKKNHVETKERNELYGFSDFISNFGGLLGLFTGFSMLSFIEIIYFLSLRIWGNIKLYKNWSGKNK